MDTTVLFVDDEPVRMAPFVTTLEDAGYKVIMATSAGEAVALANEHKGEIEALIVDIMIPTCLEGDAEVDPRRAGLWALQEIRKIPELARIPAIMLSAVSHQRVATETNELGVVTYLEKPMSLARLVEAVAQATAGNPRERC